jgi:hypothetical protein
MPEANVQNITPPSNKDAKAQKAPKEPKPKKEGAANRSSFAALYPKEASLKLLVTENPKKAGSKSFERFQHYFTSKTVGEFLSKGGTYGDIAYDIARKRIQVG